MIPLVTIGIPVYKRLDYLPQSLAAVAAQDYPQIECLVSDNGMNGTKVSDLVTRCYNRPHRFRQNAATVGQSEHYNQILHEASGKYFVILNDDDEISPNFVSELAGLLERYPHASVAIAKQESIDLAGHTLRTSAEAVPEILAGEDFIRAWCEYTYKWECFTTNLSRTDNTKVCGGYPSFPTGNGIDDALLTKLCLGRTVAFNTRCTFRKRIDEASLGFSCDYRSLAKAAKYFLTFLDTDPDLRRYAHTYPKRWAEVKGLLVKMIWETCFGRWNVMYRDRLAPLQWIRSAFAMPFIPDYYAAVAATVLDVSKNALVTSVKRRAPWAYRLYRYLK